MTTPSDEPSELRSILIVDDDTDTRHALEEALQDCGFATHIADSGQAAMSLFDADPTDIVLCDVNMRDGDGFWLLRQLRTLSLETPVFVLMTAHHDISPTLGFAEGADAFLSKPIWLSDLLFAIDRASQRRKR